MNLLFNLTSLNNGGRRSTDNVHLVIRAFGQIDFALWIYDILTKQLSEYLNGEPVNILPYNLLLAISKRMDCLKGLVSKIGYGKATERVRLQTSLEDPAGFGGVIEVII
jgi:hypothetical protein